MRRLSKLLSEKMEASGHDIGGAAEAAGLAAPSFSAVLKGESFPNARTLDKYAQYLGISVDELKNLVADAKGEAGAGAGGEGAAPRAPKAQRGRPRSVRRAVGGGSSSGLVAALETALAAAREAEALAGDALALRVSRLSAKQRGAVESLLSAFE